ncbi:putative FMN-binding domain-containing protein [Trichoderma austrokoningii]
MYLRNDHAEKSLPALRRLIRENPLGQLTTAIASPNFPLIQSSHIPFVLEVDDEASETEFGTLTAHMARANPQAKAIIEDIRSRDSLTLQQDVLVVFTSPVQHYVTPKFYTTTKPATAKVVPTWNYAAVQVYGKATFYIDSKAEETSAFLDRQLDALSRFNEETTMGYTEQDGRPSAWKVADAPEPYLNIMKKNIIGLEIKIEQMGGKFKMSQEMGDGDSDGVIKGFRDLGSEVGAKMADIVEERREMKRQASK